MTSDISALDRLERALEARAVEAELLLVGGAVMSIVFAANPGTRNGKALFGDRRLFDDALAEVGDEVGLPSDWVSAATRERVEHEGVMGAGKDGMHLRVFAPHPDYALALKCAELGHAAPEDRRAVESDVRYLLRLTGVTSAHDGMERVHTYFTPRQLPAVLPQMLEQLL